jgi:hypothetical protein
MVKYSVISVFNDEELLEDWLLSSIDHQVESEFEIVLIDNTDSEYDCAPEALNKGAERAAGDYYIFVHQDVKLLSEIWFKQLGSFIDEIDDLGICGVSGKKYHPPLQRMHSYIFQGEDKSDKITNPTEVPQEVQTVDELLAVIPASVFNKRKFNEYICDGWHLYIVEYCLWVNNKTELSVYVLPLVVWHRSKGMALGHEYFRILEKIYKKYNVKKVNTTVGIWLSEEYVVVNKILIYLVEYMPNPIRSILLNYWSVIFGVYIPGAYEDPIGAVKRLLPEGNV